MRISKINFTKWIWWPNFSVQLNFSSFLPILLYQTSTFTFTFIIPSPPLPHHSSIKSLLCLLFSFLPSHLSPFFDDPKLKWLHPLDLRRRFGKLILMFAEGLMLLVLSIIGVLMLLLILLLILFACKPWRFFFSSPAPRTLKALFSHQLIYQSINHHFRFHIFNHIMACNWSQGLRFLFCWTFFFLLSDCIGRLAFCSSC